MSTYRKGDHTSSRQAPPGLFLLVPAKEQQEFNQFLLYQFNLWRKEKNRIAYAIRKSYNHQKKFYLNLRNVKMSELVHASPFKSSSTRVTPCVKSSESSNATSNSPISGGVGIVGGSKTVVGDSFGEAGVPSAEGGGKSISNPIVKKSPTKSVVSRSKPSTSGSSKGSSSGRTIVGDSSKTTGVPAVEGGRSKKPKSAPSVSTPTKLPSKSSSKTPSVFDRLHSRTPRSPPSTSARSPPTSPSRLSSATGNGSKTPPRAGSVAQTVVGSKRGAAAVVSGVGKTTRIVKRKLDT
eukprot:TRINITY_DN3655_c0_g1_i2.p1 TRINITY_DN3655_c0_g1~~TRINITY_DN3655_c0_g1_i2.p1  ORF type:complete len:293 (-),score=57.63 TRINITY_DN3655_c0_g1_i2:142-1020(-)